MASSNTTTSTWHIWFSFSEGDPNWNLRYDEYLEFSSRAEAAEKLFACFAIENNSWHNFEYWVSTSEDDDILCLDTAEMYQLDQEGLPIVAHSWSRETGWLC